MFVLFLYRVRARDPGSAVVRCEAHMERERADVYTPLYLCSFDTGARAVLIGADDWRKRRHRAESFHDSLRDEPSTLRFARGLRIHLYFHLIEGTPALRSIRKKLLGEYDALVTGPDSERTFFAATDPIFAAAVRPDWPEDLTGPFDEYLALRAEYIRTLLHHTTKESFPFTTEGPPLQCSKCFDLGGPSDDPAYYVVMDVHM